MNATIKRFAWMALSTMLLAGGLGAQQAASASDADNSDAHIFLSSSKLPQLQVNIGVARAVGTVRESVGDPPIFDFTMYPANAATSHGAQRPGATVISFHSQNIEKLHDQSYRATGVLTVTFVERVETYDPNEEYPAPAYGPSTTFSVTHHVTFEFRPTRQGTARGGTAYTDWLASTLVTGQSFPELLQAVSNTAWPDYLAGEECSTPLTVGEDFSGSACTTETVAPAETRTDAPCGLPATVGEGSWGQICQTPSLQVPTAGDIRQIAKNGDTRQHNSLIADQVQIIVNLRVSETPAGLASSGGK